MADGTACSEVRWMMAPSDVLERIITDREMEKEKLRRTLPRHKLPPQALPSQVSTISLPTYIKILDDKDAVSLTLVTKESWVMGATQPLPRSLAGLRLPKCVNNHVRRFVVHSMSQTTARNYGLKLKARRRVRTKRKSQIEAMDPGDIDTQLDPEYVSPMDVDENGFGSPLMSSTLIGEKGVSGDASPRQQPAPVPASFPDWSPYCQHKLLVTNRLLYSGKSRGRFPADSTLYTVLMEVLESESTVALAGEQLRNFILQLPVHRVPETADKTNMNLLQTLDTLGNSGKLNGLDSILSSIVKFHLKIHNLYGLIKGCTSKWQSKFKVAVTSKPKTVALDASTYSHPSQAKKNRSQKKVLSGKLSTKVPQEAVIQGLSAILRVSGCKKLLGSNSNRRKFLKFLNKFLLAGVVSNLKLSQLLSLLNSRDCRWLDPIPDPTLKAHIFAKTVSWIFSDYVLNILKTGYHITEAEGTRLQLNFYFHETWRSVSHIVRDRLIRNRHLRLIHTLGRESLLPTATFRFIPKRDDLRPIAGIGLRKKISAMDMFNIQLLLKYLALSIAPHARGVNEFFIRNSWKKFLNDRKENSYEGSKLYYLRFDIRNAYPSVDITKLQVILREIVDLSKSYVVKDTFVGRVKRRKTSTLALKDELGCQKHCDNRGPPGARYKERAFNQKAVLFKLLKIIRSSEIVKIGKNSFHFSHGLPQGSPISQALCNIYYGHMESVHLADFLNKPGEFFCRCVDDYFFVSTDPRRVATIYQRMRDGIPDYNCFIKSTKSKTNIFISSELETSDEEWILFCGWRFSVTSGHVARDFGSYAGIDSCATLTFSMGTSNSAEDFISKRIAVIKPLRLCYLVLDPSINCKWRIAMSVFEAALMMAFRFYASCRVLYPNINSLNDPIIATTLCNAISTFANDAYSIVRRYISRFSPIQESKCSCTTHLPERVTTLDLTLRSFTSFEIRYIVYKAFMMKLTSHSRPPYVGLLGKLEKLIRDSEPSLRRREYQYLLHLIGSTMPQYFRDMKC